MKKLKIKANKTLTFQEGCEKYLEYCRRGIQEKELLIITDRAMLSFKCLYAQTA